MIGSIKERESSGTPPTAPFLPRATGFPRAHHRSKDRLSLFSSECQHAADTRLETTPPSISNQPQLRPPLALDIPSHPLESSEGSPGGMRAEISAENARIVGSMTDEQRDAERQEILTRFGGDVGDILRKAREARERAAKRSPSKGSLRRSSVSSSSDMEPGSASRSATPHSDSLHSGGTTSPGVKRTLRFADLKPSDVYVYESQPSSPKKERLALLPPPDQKDDSVINLSPSKKASHTTQSPSPGAIVTPVIEGTPEDIHHRFFPNARLDEPALAWISNGPASDDSSPFSSKIRYDLSGNPIPEHLRHTLPTHLGLHHHGAADQQAGYTLDDALHLVRSTVPAQRVAMLGLLAGVLRHLRGQKDVGESLSSSHLKIESSRREIVAAAMEAVMEKGSTIVVRAVDVIWEGIVAWDSMWDKWIKKLPPTELQMSRYNSQEPSTVSKQSHPNTESSIISALPLQSMFPLFAELLNLKTLPEVTISAILSIIEAILRSSKECIEEVVRAPVLIRSLLAIFLNTFSLFSTNASAVRDSPPIAATVLRVFRLLLATKTTAAKLIELGIPDALLRFLITLPSFLGQPSYPLTPVDRHIREALVEILRLYTDLGKYGLYCGAVSTVREAYEQTGRSILDGISSVRSALSPGIDAPLDSAFNAEAPSSLNSDSRLVLELASSWLDLLSAYLACALNPHVTIPVHDIKWSFVGKQGWRWGDDLLQFNDAIRRVGGIALPFGVWASLWNAFACYLEGSFINSTGAEWVTERGLFRSRLSGDSVVREKKTIVLALQECKTVLAALNRGTQFTQETLINLERLGSAAACIHASLRLELALMREPSLSNDSPVSGAETISQHSEPDEIVSGYPMDSVSTFCDELVANDSLWRLVAMKGAPSFAYTFLLPLTSLLSLDLQLRYGLKRWQDNAWTERWLAHGNRVLCRLFPSDELHGEWIIGAIAKLIDDGFVKSFHWQVPQRVWDLGGVNIIIPFLKDVLHPVDDQTQRRYGDHAMGDDSEYTPTYLCSYSTNSESIGRATQVLLPSSSALRSWVDGSASEVSRWGLPVALDWCFAPLEHLLKPDGSRIFRNGLSEASISNAESSRNDAPGHTVTETDLVRASLLFAGVLTSLEPGTRTRNPYISYSEIVVACMKVFMLEHGQRQLDSSDEVFRDTFVSTSMLSLLSRARLDPSSSKQTPHSLELVSRNFLGPSTPFFQFYTDFITLYDAVSFSDPLFASLLIPPLSMDHPYGYRKLLWVDFSHLLHTIHTDVSHPAIHDVGGYLWPAESHGDVMNAYVNALCRHGPRALSDGVLRFIALHHVSCHIWPDIATGSRDASTPAWNEPKAQKLFMMLLLTAPHGTVQQIVFYRQHSDGPVLMPPACFGNGTMIRSTTPWERSRRDLVSRWGGAAAMVRLQDLFEPV